MSGSPWVNIVPLYDQLLKFNPSPVVVLNRAVAVSFALEPESGLAEFEIANDNNTLSNFQPYQAALADIHRRMNNADLAANAYELAIHLSGNIQERSYLQSRLRSLQIT